MATFSKIVQRVSRVGNWVGLCFLVAMMLLVVSDVILRPLGKPIKPVYELVEILAAVAISFAILYATLEKAHIVIDILALRLPQRARAIFESCTSFIGLGTWALLATASAIFTRNQWLLNEQTQITKIPITPFRYLWLFAMIMLCLLLLLQMSEAISKAVTKGGSK